MEKGPINKTPKPLTPQPLNPKPLNPYFLALHQEVEQPCSSWAIAARSKVLGPDGIGFRVFRVKVFFVGGRGGGGGGGARGGGKGGGRGGGGGGGRGGGEGGGFGVWRFSF